MFVKCERKLFIVPTNLRVHIYSSNYIHSWKPQELKLIKTIMGRVASRHFYKVGQRLVFKILAGAMRNLLSDKSLSHLMKIAIESPDKLQLKKLSIL